MQLKAQIFRVHHHETKRRISKCEKYLESAKANCQPVIKDSREYLKKYASCNTIEHRQVRASARKLKEDYSTLQFASQAYLARLKKAAVKYHRAEYYYQKKSTIQVSSR